VRKCSVLNYIFTPKRYLKVASKQISQNLNSGLEKNLLETKQQIALIFD
jgi:hypothetical protein